MDSITRTLQHAYERSEDLLGRSWPVWVVALLFYAAASYVLLTKVRLPSGIYLFVFSMGLGIIIITVLKVEWAILGLVAMIPFARPGISFGPAKHFHVSGFNIALVGVCIVYVLRYFIDKDLSSKGPLVRKTPLDGVIGIFLALTLVSTLVGLNKNWDPVAQARVLLYCKEQFLYFAWFWLIVTLLRTPEDLRRFTMFFATSGILVAIAGIVGRFSGTVEAVTATSAQMEMGVVGGQTGGVAGGFLGLGHPNFLAAFLIMSMPLWFFGVDHLRRAGHRLITDLAILIGFVGIFFTYSRSAWSGITAGILMLGVTYRRAITRIIVFGLIFLVIVNILSFAYVRMDAFTLISLRFEQLNRSNFSSRPEIFKSAFEVIRDNPFLGVGPGSFSWHARNDMVSGVLSQAHNVVLTFAAEMGTPAALMYILMMFLVFRMSLRSLRKIGGVPGYGFIAQGTYTGLFAITAQTLFVHLFYHRNVGYAYWAMIAIIVVLYRFVEEGVLTAEGRAEGYAATPAPGEGMWIQ